MTRLASTYRILLYSAFVGLIVVLGICPTTQPAHAQTNFQSYRKHLMPKFSRAMLLRPTAFLEANHPFVQSAFFVDDTKGDLRLESKFLGSLKFIYNGQTPRKVYGFWGLTFKPEFQETLSLHPPALNEAKKAYPFNTLKLVGTLGLVVMSAKLFIDSVNDSQEISRGRLVDGGSSTTDFVLIGVAGTVTIVSGILSKNHLKNGVRIFNERQK